MLSVEDNQKQEFNKHAKCIHKNLYKMLSLLYFFFTIHERISFIGRYLISTSKRMHQLDKDK